VGGISGGVAGANPIVALLVYDGTTDTIIAETGIVSVTRGGAGHYTVTVAAWVAAGKGNGVVAMVAEGSGGSIAAGYVVDAPYDTVPYGTQVDLQVSTGSGVPEDAAVNALFW
jgi:hypothetical protein